MTSEFFKKLSQDFTQLLESEYGHDVTFEVEQSSTSLFKAHSVVLYQRSSYFRQKLANANKKNNVIEIKLPNVSAEIFNVIIRYIYSGVISLENFEASAIFDLLLIINEFMFPELVDHFQHILIDNNATWLRLNFSRVYQISFQNENFLDLQKFCNDIITKHPRMIFDSDDFNNLQENALISLLKNDYLQMYESEIWDKIILWGKTKTPNLPPNLKEWTDDNFKSLKTTLQNCLPHIRYFQISGEDVIKKIKPYRNILEENTWDDMISKLVAPNLPITSLILPPRKKTTLQIPLGKEIFNVCFNDDGDVSFNDGGENSLGSRTIRKARKGRSRDDML
ncbi:BTB/POZ protein, partial [Gigaspora rosea]